MYALSAFGVDMGFGPTDEQDYVSIENSIDRARNDEDVVARYTVRRDSFVPVSMYWLTADQISYGHWTFH